MNRKATGVVKVACATILFSLNPTLFSLAVGVPPTEIFWIVNAFATLALMMILLIFNNFIVHSIGTRGEAVTAVSSNRKQTAT